MQATSGGPVVSNSYSGGSTYAAPIGYTSPPTTSGGANAYTQDAAAPIAGSGGTSTNTGVVPPQTQDGCSYYGCKPAGMNYDPILGSAGSTRPASVPLPVLQNTSTKSEAQTMCAAADGTGINWIHVALGAVVGYFIAKR